MDAEAFLLCERARGYVACFETTEEPSGRRFFGFWFFTDRGLVGAVRVRVDFASDLGGLLRLGYFDDALPLDGVRLVLGDRIPSSSLNSSLVTA